jgi:hypothetical protein
MFLFIHYLVALVAQIMQPELEADTHLQVPRLRMLEAISPFFHTSSCLGA